MSRTFQPLEKKVAHTDLVKQKGCILKKKKIDLVLCNALWVKRAQQQQKKLHKFLHNIPMVF